MFFIDLYVSGKMVHKITFKADLCSANVSRATEHAQYQFLHKTTFDVWK